MSGKCCGLSWSGDTHGHWVCDGCGKDHGPQEYEQILDRMMRAEASRDALVVANADLVYRLAGGRNE